jgi:hypothetical protein
MPSVLDTKLFLSWSFYFWPAVLLSKVVSGTGVEISHGGCSSSITPTWDKAPPASPFGFGDTII